MTQAYRVFGLDIASSFPFTFRLLEGAEPPDLSFEASLKPLEEKSTEDLAAAYTSPIRDEAGRSALRILRRPGSDLLVFPGVADFSLEDRSILYRPYLPERRGLIEIRFLGTVLSFYLERREVPVLHASAVDLDGGAVIFLGTNRGGKTGLAASFLTAGYSMLSDDLSPLDVREGRFFVRPGYPQMRAWPDLASRLVGSAEGLPRVLPELEKRRISIGGQGGLGSFCPDAKPLRALYLPERRPPGGSAEVRIEEVSARDAVVDLIRTSFIARLVDALGWQPRRLAFFSRLVVSNPVRRLIYPSGFEHLDRVREAVLEDLAR